MTLQEAAINLRTVQHEVFGSSPGDCPDPVKDYDRAIKLMNMMRRSIEAVERASVAEKAA